MARATPLQKHFGTIQKCAVEADRAFNNHVAGDSGFGRPVKRPTRFKDPLKQSALSAGALSAGALSAGALSAGALSAGPYSTAALPHYCKDGSVHVRRFSKGGPISEWKLAAVRRPSANNKGPARSKHTPKPPTADTE